MRSADGGMAQDRPMAMCSRRGALGGRAYSLCFACWSLPPIFGQPNSAHSVNFEMELYQFESEIGALCPVILAEEKSS